MTKLSGPERLPSGKIAQVVIFLHGLGSNGDDLLGLAPMLIQALPRTAFLAPNAPFAMPYSANGFQWFDLWERTIFQIEQGVRASAPLIADYIHDTAERFSLPLSKVALVGFSQGTMMALHVGLRLVDGLAGVVGYSGAMVGMETLMLEKRKTLCPILLVHGGHDTVVPLFMSQQADFAIRSVGGKSRLVTRPSLIHSIDNIGIEEGIAFLQNCFQGEKS